MGWRKFLQDKVIIITGASSGIGKGLAIEAGKAGAKVVLAARSEDKLQEVAKEVERLGGQALAVRTDVTNREDCKNLVDKTLEKFGKIDILINNAGITMRAMFDELKLEVFDKVMDINFNGTVNCTYAAIKEVLKQKGWIVGISSAAGTMPFPSRTAYSASKFAMYGFLISLYSENLKRGLNVLIVHPGWTASNIRKTALTADGTPQGESPRNEKKMMTPEQLARRIYRAIYKKRLILTVTFENKVAYWIHKCFPRFSAWLMNQVLRKEPNSPIP